MGKYFDSCDKEDQILLISQLVRTIEKSLGISITDGYIHNKLEKNLENLFIEKGLFNNPDLIDRRGYVAWKLWHREDIRQMLIEKGYEPSLDNIEKVIQSGYLKHLSDCTDQEWDIIGYAIDESLTCLDRDDF